MLGICNDYFYIYHIINFIFSIIYAFFNYLRYNPNFWLFASCAPEGRCITPGMYAMVGAAATFGGISRMTG